MKGIYEKFHIKIAPHQDENLPSDTDDTNKQNPLRQQQDRDLAQQLQHEKLMREIRMHQRQEVRPREQNPADEKFEGVRP